MRKYFKIIANYLLNKIAGKKKLQRFFERLHQLSIAGMNFGNVDIRSNGEKEVIKYLKMRISKDANPVIFDVGANIGDYSKEVFSVLGENVKLHCFEPSKEAFATLEENLKNYKNIKLYNFGFGEKNKNAVLYSNKKGSGLASLYDRKLEYHDIKMDKQEETIIRRLDDFCRENRIEHIDFLKLDIEGNEFNALRGASDLIMSSAIDFIQFEFGGTDIDSKIYFRDFFFFLNPNYKIFRILKNGLFLIDKYNERYEVFMAINYLAVSRTLYATNRSVEVRKFIFSFLPRSYL